MVNFSQFQSGRLRRNKYADLETFITTGATKKLFFWHLVGVNIFSHFLIKMFFRISSITGEFFAVDVQFEFSSFWNRPFTVSKCSNYHINFDFIRVQKYTLYPSGTTPRDLIHFSSCAGTSCRTSFASRELPKSDGPCDLNFRSGTNCTISRSAS